MPPTPILDPGHLQRVRDHRDVVPKEGSRRQGFGAGRWDRSCHSQADRPSHRFLDGRPAPSCAALTSIPGGGSRTWGTPAGEQSAVAGVTVRWAAWHVVASPVPWVRTEADDPPGPARRQARGPAHEETTPNPKAPVAAACETLDPWRATVSVSLHISARSPAPADEIGRAFLGTEEKYRVRMSSVISRRNRESDVYSGRVFRYLPCYSMLPFLGVPGAKRRGDVGAEPRRRAGERLQAGQRRSGTSGDPHPQWSRSHHRSPDVARKGERPEGRG